MDEPTDLHRVSHDVEKYWDDRVRTLDGDCARVDASRRAQAMRFESFVLHHSLEGRSLLDVGCGVGDLCAHVQRRVQHFDYLGVDISGEMVRRSRERFPTQRFDHVNILEWNTAERWDYVTAFAIHNVRMDGGRELLEAVTRRQFELCRIAAHVDLLTDRFAGFASHIQPWKPEDVLSLALSITPYVVLRHDYLPNSFSVTLYREPLIDTRKDLLL